MLNFLSIILASFLLISPISATAAENTVTNNEFDWYYSYDKNTKTLLSPKETPYITDDIALFKGKDTEKVLYITFDEGYENGFTESILKTLKNNNVPAAFFVTKPYITENPELIKQMVKENHLVCNHTVKHKSMPKLIGSDNFKKEFTGVEQAYKEVTGKDIPKYFRPPMGKYSHKALIETKNLGYTSVFWSFAYRDWLVNNQPNPSAATKQIISNIHNGQILLLHACSKTNSQILDSVIKELKSQGYEFKSLDDLMVEKQNTQ